MLGNTKKYDSTLGAIEIGTVISVYLFGIGTVQAYSYYQNCAGDSWCLKLLVAFIWTMELGHTMCSTHTVYYTTITLYGFDYPNGPIKYQSLNISILFATAITATVQLYYINRVWKLFEKPYIAYSCIFLLLSAIGGVIAFLSHAFSGSPVAQDLQVAGWLVMALLTDSACIDCIVSGSLCWYYLKNRNGTESFERSQRLLDQLIAFTIQTSLLTSFASLAAAICFRLFTPWKNYTWLGVYLILTKLYSNCLFASLNARTMFRATMEQHNSVKFPTNVLVSERISHQLSALVDIDPCREILASDYTTESPHETEEKSGAQVEEATSPNHDSQTTCIPPAT